MGKLFYKYKKLNIQTRAAIWFVICSILQKGISFITTPIFTRIMTTSEYGTYSLYLSWLQIFTIITSLNLYYGVFNNALVKFKNDIDRYIASMQGLIIFITLSLFILFCVTSQIWVNILSLSCTIIILMFIEMFVTPAISFWSGKQRFEYRYKKLVTVTLIKSLANPILGLIAVTISQDKATSRIFSITIVEVLFCGILMLVQFYKGKAFFVKKYWQYALRLAIPLLPHYFSSMILNQGDRIMIEKMVGLSEVALYSVAYSIGMLVQVITQAINSSFTPWVYQKIKNNDISKIGKTVNNLLVIVSVAILFIILCSPELVLIFGSTDYAQATYVIPPVAASTFFIFLYNILAIPQFYFEKTKFMLFASMGTAFLNILLNFIFIKKFGYIAAGYTTLVCYILYSLGHAIISTKIIKNEMYNQSIYDISFILKMSLIVIVVGIVANFIFNYFILRYLILSVLIVFFIINKKYIQNLNFKS